MNEAMFWVRVHDLPLMAHNEYVDKEVGAGLGTMVEVEVDLDYGEVEWGEFMRTRVNMDISKPLLRQKMLNLDLPEPAWVRFSYEHILDFCYCCGRLGHM